MVLNGSCKTLQLLDSSLNLDHLDNGEKMGTLYMVKRVSSVESGKGKLVSKTSEKIENGKNLKISDFAGNETISELVKNGVRNGQENS